jgi:hypothetical protein
LMAKACEMKMKLWGWKNDIGQWMYENMTVCLAKVI